MTRDLRVLARAKLTLSLRVLGRRPDGFHDLESLVVSLRDPHDVVGLRIQPPFGVRVRLSGRAVIGVPVDETNLAVRAARLLLEAAAGADDPGPWAAAGLDLSLHKTIPAGAGLGGGSADAAGTLVGGARLLGLGLDTADLAALGASLGSDVPFCVAGGAAWMRGRGEVLEPLPLPAAALAAPPPAPDPPQQRGTLETRGTPQQRGTPAPAVPTPSTPSSLPGPPGSSRLPAGATPPGPSPAGPRTAGPHPGGISLVVAVPDFPLATAAVYRAWDDLGGPSSTRPVRLPEGLAGLGLPDHLVNDLEPAAEHVEPRLRPFREALEAVAGAPALLAGSGSAYVVPVESPAQATMVAARAGAELRATAFATGLAARGVEPQKGAET